MKDKLGLPKGNPQGNGNHDAQLKRRLGFGLAAVAGLVLVLWLVQHFVLAGAPAQAREIPYSEFKQKLRAGEIVRVEVAHAVISGEMRGEVDGQGTGEVPFVTQIIPTGDPQLAEALDAAGVQYGVAQPELPLTDILLLRVLPIASIAMIGFVVYRRASENGGGLGNMMGMNKKRSSEVKPEDVTLTFADVGGVDEAIVELEEIIHFLKTPEKFAHLGGRVPKGVLLVGPPGTGKTLLAKATAGEAHVRFFETSGSEFMEMFVGVGAARVRTLFEQARKAAPAVVFIDEIDSIGQSRAGASNVRSGATDEREQTLNQLLAEIDGFRANTDKPVIIMAATNRPEVLDPALLRAGRFDRQIAVGQPDLVGRLQILRIHCQNVTLAEDFDLERAARMTPGFTGADLANVMNEAALLAARRGADAVAVQDFEAAIERVIAGLERKTRIMNEQERRAIAFHEAGHALIAGLVDHADPVAKISIIPRGRGALGYTMQMPLEDRYVLTAEELIDRIAVYMGGRAAEKIVLGTVSTGASDDIMKATDLARRMVVEYGMSEALGSVRYCGQHLQYLDGGAPDGREVSPRVRELIDSEVQRFVMEQYERAQRLLIQHRYALDNLTQNLLERESLDGSAVTNALQCPALAA